MFIGSFINLFLSGHIMTRIKSSILKKMTTRLSMMSMMVTTRGNSDTPSSFSWSSSAVEMIKVTVDTNTAESEVSAKIFKFLEKI